MTKKIKNKLFALTGLNTDELADVLDLNPRAYMALKGAVAEKHLENILRQCEKSGVISTFKRGCGDFAKDFYVKSPGFPQEISIECKNVQVINIGNTSLMRKYIQFLAREGLVEKNLTDKIDSFGTEQVKEIYRRLPAHIRESGMERYLFSAHLSDVSKIDLAKVSSQDYLAHFSQYPISIDFQRTRNSRNGNGEDNGHLRFYRHDEIDILAACLFSRTMRWEFVYCSRQDFPLHSNYSDRFSNNFKIIPAVWHKSIGDCISELKKKRRQK